LGEADEIALRRADRVDHHMGPELRAVLAHAPALALEAAGALGLRQRQRRDVLRLLSFSVEGREMTADDLVRLIALEAPGTGVPAGHAALAIQHVDRVISDRLDEESVATVAGLGGFEAVRGFHANPIPAPAGVGRQSGNRSLPVH